MKPLLIGMNNPYSNDPRYALYPHPQRSTGHRTMLLLKEAGARVKVDISPLDYADKFDRMNVLNEEGWNDHRASVEGGKILPTLKYRTVVIFGKAVAKALGYKKSQFSVAPQVDKHWDFTYFVVPHPSGMCREYNDPVVRKQVGNLLLDLYFGKQR